MFISSSSITTRWARRGLLLTCVAFLSLGVLLALPATALAHADYASSTPAMNAELDKAPTAVSITFTEDINPTGSAIVVYDVNGVQVSGGTATVDTTNQKRMSIPMQGNGSETYIVLWRTVAADDSHHTSGSFRFFANISPMLKGMLKNENTSATSSSMTATTSSSNGVATWLVGIIALVALIIGGAGGLLLGKRGKQTA